MSWRIFEGEMIAYFPVNIDALRGVLETVASSAPTVSGVSVVKASPPPIVCAPAPPSAQLLPRNISFSPARGRTVKVLPPAPASSDRAPESWRIGLSKRFKESATKTDRKRQGRILEAVMSLTEDPMKVVGDTVKPLSEDKKGYWRRRVGDYRLTYLPDPDLGLITLVDFEARGSAYA